MFPACCERPTPVLQQEGWVQEGGGGGLEGDVGELCQEGPLQLGTGPKPVDGEVDAKSAKKSNNLVSNVLIYDYFWLFTLRQNWMMCNKTL